MMLATTYFQWVWAIPVAVLLGIGVLWLVRRGVARRRARLAALGTPAMLERLAPGVLRRGSRWRAPRLAAAALLGGLALAGPRWGAEETVVRQSGIDIVLALDASLSMLATDERPTRLERMKEEVRRLRARSPADRIGLLAFAGRSYVLTPPTLDGGALELFLDNLDPSIVGQAGSALAPPIRQATALLALSTSEADQAIVLMSDGEGFEDESAVLDAARDARRRGTHLVTVGYGTEQGSTIPVRSDGQIAQHRDQSGQIVVTRYVPDLLRAAAQTAQGEFIPPGAQDRALAVRGALDRLRAERRTVRSSQFFALRFQWFVFPAIALLLLDALLATRHRRQQRRRLAMRKSLDDLPRAAAILVGAVSLLSLSGCDLWLLMRDPHVVAYNRGTEALLADSLERARPPLRIALESQRNEVRYRAGFNLGVTHLVEGLAAEADAAEAPLDSALAAYKAVLLENPSDFDSKWNYELALRRRTGGGGGGGGGGGAGGGGGGAEQPQPQPSPQGGITPQPRHGLTVEDAERVLDAVADQERDVQGRSQRRTVPQPPPAGKDW